LAERLNDGPLQELTALRLRAANLVRPGSAGGIALEARVSELEQLARAALDGLTRIIDDLRGGDSGRADLFVRLSELCDQFRAASGIDCRQSIEPAHVRLAPPIDEVIHRAVNELLTNVRQHSQATVVRITSQQHPDGAVAITVADNGIGLSTTARQRNPFVDGGFGLWSIEYRLGEFGATLETENSVGLRVTIVVPGRFVVAG
jgi:signal transduction histidine kinase